MNFESIFQDNLESYGDRQMAYWRTVDEWRKWGYISLNSELTVIDEEGEEVSFLETCPDAEPTPEEIMVLNDLVSKFMQASIPEKYKKLFFYILIENKLDFYLTPDVIAKAEEMGIYNNPLPSGREEMYLMCGWRSTKNGDRIFDYIRKVIKEIWK